MSRPKQLLRFCKLPSILFTDDPTVSEDERREAMALELEPRPQDQGQASYWEATHFAEDQAEQENQVLIGLTACQKLQKRKVLRVSAQWVEDLQIELSREPDPRVFGCIARQHVTLSLRELQTRQQLAAKILKTPRQEIERVLTEKEIKSLIPQIYSLCSRAETPLDLTPAQTWAKDLIKPI